MLLLFKLYIQHPLNRWLIALFIGKIPRQENRKRRSRRFSVRDWFIYRVLHSSHQILFEQFKPFFILKTLRAVFLCSHPC